MQIKPTLEAILINDDRVAMLEGDPKKPTLIVTLEDGNRFRLTVKKLTRKQH